MPAVRLSIGSALTISFGLACRSYTFDGSAFNVLFQKVQDLHLGCLFNPLTAARANKLACNFLVMNRQPLESCSNPLRIQQVFQSKSKKKKFCFRFRILQGDRHKGECFCFFQPPLAGPGPQPIGPFFWLKIFLETKLKSVSLEPLNDFLAYLQRKLQTKHQKFVKISVPTNLSLWWKTPLFYMANSRQWIELESCSNPL